MLSLTKGYLMLLNDVESEFESIFYRLMANKSFTVSLSTKVSEGQWFEFV